MGLIAETFSVVRGLLPERKTAVGAAVSTWDAGNPMLQKESYYRFALEGYQSNEIMFASIEEIASSASEPRLAVMRKTAKGVEQIKDHPLLAVFERPNPFMSRYELMATLLMFRGVAGNAYLEKVRSGAGKIVELWPLRPDRMWVIPDRERHIRGWQYRLGAETYYLDANDVIHSRTRNPLDDYYGMPPARPAAVTIDTANAMRAFTHAFFRNAGVPAGLLTFEKQVSAAEAQLIRDRFHNDYGGMNAHGVMVLGGAGAGQVQYTAMGLPLGERGLVMPELDEMSDAKIAAVFGVPLELIGARLGMIHGNRSTTKEARATFWDETLVPLYQEIAAALTLSLQPEYGDFDYLEFDLSTVKALQEDESAKVDRVVKKLQAAVCSVQEARAELGYEPEYEAGAILVMPDNISGLPADQLDAPPAPPPALTAPGQQQQNDPNVNDQPPQDDQQPTGRAKIALLEPRAIEAPAPQPVVNVNVSDGRKTVIIRKTIERDEEGRPIGLTEYREEEAV